MPRGHHDIAGLSEALTPSICAVPLGGPLGTTLLSGHSDLCHLLIVSPTYGHHTNPQGRQGVKALCAEEAVLSHFFGVCDTTRPENMLVVED